MKKTLELIGFLLTWFAVGAQLVLMIQNRQADLLETFIRFFSFFTILTNILVALFFTAKVFQLKKSVFRLFRGDGAITAVTAFILVVGLVYQFILRNMWHPTGLQMIVDELLHTFIPLLMLGYFLLTVEKRDLHFKLIFRWLWYPFSYLIAVMVRGYFSNYYPYPFLDLKQIDGAQVLINILSVIIFNLILIFVLRFAGNYSIHQKIKKL